MFRWVIQMTIISLVLIFLIHHLINFFKMTLTVPKLKDLVDAPIKKYDDIYKIINSSPPKETEYTLIDLLPQKQSEDANMKSELKNFLKSQLDNSNSNFPALEEISNYSTF